MPLGNIKQSSRDVNRGKHREQNAQNQGDGKATNLIRPDGVEHDRSDQGGQVGIDDGYSCLPESVANRHSRRRAFLQFFANPFKNQHVCVYRHPNRQNQAS